MKESVTKAAADPNAIPVSLDINGKVHELRLDPRTTLLDALRERLDLTVGVKGIGEIGIVAVAPAIANAVYHATGKRIRDLPITVEKLM